MKPLKIGILISVVFHFLVLAVLFLVGNETLNVPEFVEVTYVIPRQPVAVSKPIPEEPPKLPRPTNIPPKTDKEEPKPIPIEEAEAVVVADTVYQELPLQKGAKEILTETLTFRVQKALLEFQVPDSLIEQADTSKAINVLMALQDVHRFGSPEFLRDRVAEDLYNRSFGGPKPVPMTNLLAAGAALLTKALSGDSDKKPKLTFIPTESEIDVLDVLWDEGRKSQLDIYAALDSTNVLSAHELNRVLEQMVGKRLLKRKLISPRDELILFGIARVEKRELNRLNRVYVYEPLVEKQQMLQFLNAVLYQVASGGDISFAGVADSTGLRKNLSYKITKIADGR